MTIAPLLLHAAMIYHDPAQILSAAEIGREFSSDLECYKTRHAYTTKFCFPVICAEILAGVIGAAGGRRVVEIGSGSGYLATILAKRGVEITATDPAPRITNYGQRRGFFAPVIQQSATEAVLAHCPDVLLASWPCFAEPWAGDAMKMLRDGSRIIYIGEREGGCTGDDAMHDFLAAQRLIHDCAIPQFQGLRDRLFIYEVVRAGQSIEREIDDDDDR